MGSASEPVRPVSGPSSSLEAAERSSLIFDEYYIWDTRTFSLRTLQTGSNEFYKSLINSVNYVTYEHTILTRYATEALKMYTRD